MLALTLLVAVVGVVDAGGVLASGPVEHVAESKGTKVERARREVAALWAAYHARFKRDKDTVIGAVYGRYSSRFQDSIADQIRTLLEDAQRRNIYVPFEHIYYDMAVRGYKNDRDGLNGLRACLAAKKVAVVFFFATNRLFRKSYRSLAFVEEQVVERGIRAIFAKSGIDTADGKRWRMLLNANAMIDEYCVDMNVDNIRASHEGLLEKRLVFGTISFGYCGVAIPGQFTRRGRPSKRLAIDEMAADWVRRIYHWHVVDRLDVIEIVRRLRADPTAPKPAKADRWSRASVIKLLKNSRYRGLWHYGVEESIWLSSKDYTRQMKRDNPLKSVQIEEFRVIADDLYYRAQVLLADEATKNSGRKTKDGTPRSRLLNGLFICPTHNRKLYVGGPNGRSMFCKDCQANSADDRPLFSLLPIDVAQRKTCEAVASLIRSDESLAERIVEACRHHAALAQAPDPARKKVLESSLARLEPRIRFILRNPGETDADRDESEATLKALRKDRSEATAELQSLLASSAKAIAVPTPEEAMAELDRLAAVLTGAATSTESSGLVRELIDAAMGGAINLYQCGERASKKGWLEGRFPNRIIEAAIRKLTGVEIEVAGEQPQEIVIVYRREKEAFPGELRDEIISMYQADRLVKQIARELGANRNTVADVLDEWFAARGETRPDGRSRRAKLATKHLEAPLYQCLAEKVHELAEENLLFDDIASELGADRNTITAAWGHWHTSRGLPVPDGRTRRKSLAIKTRPRRGSDGDSDASPAVA